MPFSSKAIANELLGLAEERGQALTPMKLQKLVYFAHGWCAAIRDESLIDEQVEAWSYGPVVPSLYHEFKEYGDQPIQSRALEYDAVEDPETGELCARSFQPGIEEESDAGRFARRLLGRVWDVYGQYSGIQLSNLTHEPGTPWRQVYDQNGGQLLKGTDIPYPMIREYFRSLASSGAAR